MNLKLSQLLPAAEKKVAIIMLSSTVLMITWKYFGTADFYRDHVAPRGMILDTDYSAAVYMFVTCLTLLGLVPMLIVKFAFGESLADYGMQVGNWRTAVKWLIPLIPVFVMASYFASSDPSVRDFYPINRSAKLAFLPHALLFFGFYVGWEFHFRGFLQHGLRSRFGSAGAIWVQVMASTLIHIGLPTAETYLAIVAGIFWGLIAFQTRSLLAGLLMHFTLGIAADYFLLYT
jgi:membrane protease YdiL (CAAX protease family)